jgi:hypothetical protein
MEVADCRASSHASPGLQPQPWSKPSTSRILSDHLKSYAPRNLAFEFDVLSPRRPIATQQQGSLTWQTARQCVRDALFTDTLEALPPSLFPLGDALCVLCQLAARSCSFTPPQSGECSHHRPSSVDTRMGTVVRTQKFADYDPSNVKISSHKFDGE